jgi:cytochrome bd-type quinol oxidase subunit 2
MNHRARSWLTWIGVAVLVASSLYCAMWFFAASDLAFDSCNGHFSLFAPTFRCRQPYVAAILCVVSLLLAAWLFWIERRGRRTMDGH